MRNSKLSMRRSEDRVVKRLPAAEGNCALLSALGQACPTSLCLLSVSQALKALSQLGVFRVRPPLPDVLPQTFQRLVSFHDSHHVRWPFFGKASSDPSVWPTRFSLSSLSSSHIVFLINFYWSIVVLQCLLVSAVQQNESVIHIHIIPPSLLEFLPIQVTTEH